MSVGCSASDTLIDCGKPGDYATTGLHQVQDASANPVQGKGILIGRDANGLYAFNALCTHSMCDMSNPKSVIGMGPFLQGGTVNGDGSIHCWCHDSEFAADGSAKSGPALDLKKGPLTYVALFLCDDGKLYADYEVTVPASSRVNP